ncbi:MAG: DUF2249 domain-containing protein [Chitinophagaceae bacterium]|nr:DUF2249 domain-containing protein [Chitinophagaceae bacterium]
MMSINADTKIATLLKANPDALEAIISISSKFTKLRNPLLRRIMASRTTIAMASKIGACTAEDFFEKLQPLGFIINKEYTKLDTAAEQEIPSWMQQIDAANVTELDVRGMLESGEDPFRLITKTIQPMAAGCILKLINTFEPVPLILLLGKQGFEAYNHSISKDLVHTYFYKKEITKNAEMTANTNPSAWDEQLKYFENKLQTIDVRHLPMPQPMLTILAALDNLPTQQALYVIHKRIPVFLLPELADRNMTYRVKEVAEGEVYLLIFKEDNDSANH